MLVSESLFAVIYKDSGTRTVVVASPDTFPDGRRVYTLHWGGTGIVRAGETPVQIHNSNCQTIPARRDTAVRIEYSNEPGIYPHLLWILDQREEIGSYRLPDFRTPAEEAREILTT